MLIGMSVAWCASCIASVAVAYAQRKRFADECRDFENEAQQCNMHLRYIQQEASSKGGITAIIPEQLPLAQAMAYDAGVPLEGAGKYLRRMVYPEFDQIAARYEECIHERNDTLWLMKLMTWTMSLTACAAVVVGIRVIILWYR